MAETRGRIAWVLPSLIEGSGGHRTILQNIEALIGHGYECHVYLEPKAPGAIAVRSETEARATIERLFGRTRARVHVGFDIRDAYDLVFATAWYTARIVAQLKQTARRAYFVQDFEALFNPMGDGYLMAEESYRLGLTPVTIGRWLAHKLWTEYRCPADFFDFCADTRLYRPDPAVRRERAVCFICQPEKPRRCPRIGIEALAIVKSEMPDAQVYLYGSKRPVHAAFDHHNLGLISVQGCRDLYRRCSAGLCISSSNPSRIPFEMMAAGLPVVDVHRENNLFDMPEGGVLLADPRPAALAKAILTILRDEDLQAQMSAFGPRFMADRSLEAGFDQFVRAVDQIVDGTFVGQTELAPMYRAAPIEAPAASTPAPVRMASSTLELELSQRMHALAEVDRVENSRAWRLLQRLKGNPAYRMLARVRFGPDWDSAPHREDPRVRLARIHNSNAYRLIRTVKRTWLYRRYAARKYGLEP